MSVQKRLSEVFNKSEKIVFNNSSRIVLISDCHRGDGSWADDFSKNQNLFFTALQHYYNNQYTYIELGDGDELWKNKNPNDIISEHKNAFWIMSQFLQKNRLYLIFGNHDICKRRNKFMKKYFYEYYNEAKHQVVPIFKDIKVHEGLILEHEDTKNKIFLVHGNQGDILNDKLWRLTCFLVRYIWRHLELIGVKDPTSTNKNYKRKEWIEKQMMKWVEKENQMLIAGHTHRPVFSKVNEVSYFNDGSCVHPRCITCIEIFEGNIMLVKWSIKVKEDGVLFAGRDILEGPNKLKDYFS